LLTGHHRDRSDSAGGGLCAASISSDTRLRSGRPTEDGFSRRSVRPTLCLRPAPAIPLRVQVQVRPVR
jgi:hypothetical protein